MNEGTPMRWSDVDGYRSCADMPPAPPRLAIVPKCERCGGQGYDPEEVGHHPLTHAPEPVDCRACRGSGSDNADEEHEFWNRRGL